jgi:hypothetical protein
VERGCNWLAFLYHGKYGSLRVQRSSVGCIRQRSPDGGALLACCKAGPSLKLGSSRHPTEVMLTEPAAVKIWRGPQRML